MKQRRRFSRRLADYMDQGRSMFSITLRELFLITIICALLFTLFINYIRKARGFTWEQTMPWYDPKEPPKKPTWFTQLLKDLD